MAEPLNMRASCLSLAMDISQGISGAWSTESPKPHTSPALGTSLSQKIKDNITPWGNASLPHGLVGHSMAPSRTGRKSLTII